MKIATSTCDFSSYFFTYEEQIREIAKAGFKYVDLCLYEVNVVNKTFSDEVWLDEVQKLKDLASELNITYVQAHSPGKGGDPIKEDNFDAYLKASIRVIEICGELGIKNTVYHGGMLRDIGKEEWFEKNLVFVKLLLPYLEKHNVNLLIENNTKANLWGIYYPNSGKDLREFVDYVNHKNFGACWDTGHANCEGAQYDEILALGDKLWALHYNDNRGTADEHVLPYFGTMNNDEVLSALKEINYKGYFTLESNKPAIFGANWPISRRYFNETMDEAPLFLRREMEVIAYKISKYILEKHGVFEE